MDFGIYKNRRTALLFLGAYETLPGELASWAISDLDAFFENLDMWADPNVAPLQALFSRPIGGIRQHLADCAHTNVGLAGLRLVTDQEILAEAKRTYLKHGYDVIELGSQKVNFTQRMPDNKVRVVLL